MNGEGTGEGIETGAGTGQETPAWLAQLPDDLKANETFTEFKTIGDLGKSYLELQGKASEVDGLKGRLENAIVKPGENATEEEVQAYRKSLGVPDSPDGYEFTPAEGVEHNDDLINWAKQTFHAADIPADKAQIIQASWDKFQQEVEKSMAEAAVKEEETADAELKKKWGADYDKNKEFSARAYTHFSEKLPAFDDLLKQVVVGDKTLGNHAVMTEVFHIIGTAMGEDFSPQGSQSRSKSAEPGIVYDKSPPPPSA